MFIPTRKETWGADLSHFISLSMKQGDKLVLDWKNNTCGSWVGDCIMFMTDEDMFHDFRGCDSQLAFARKLLSLGHHNVESYVASVLPKLSSPAMAQRGDVVMVPIEESQVASTAEEVRASICLADPPNIWVLTSQGLGRGVITDALSAYAVGRTVD
jgi:hypothetical protein